MIKCPNCGAELDDSADICISCGNPLDEGKPWEKKSKSSKNQEKPTEAAEEHGKAKVKHQTRRPARGQYERGVAVLEEANYLDDEFVIKEGYCGYDLVSGREELPEGEKEPKLKEGTIILTKRAILFGPSDHAIRCRKFVYEIPTELVECITDAEYRNKPALLIRTTEGEDFKFFVMKREDWIRDFRYAAVNYVPAEKTAKKTPAEGDAVGTDAAEEKGSFSKRWLRPLLYALAAIICVVYALVRASHLQILFIVFGLIFAVFAVVEAISPGKIKLF